MRLVVFVAALVAAACQTRAEPSPTVAATEATFPLRVSGTSFIDASGRTFAWRGITAFRLAGMLAAGRESEVVAYLDWASAERLNVVRVLAMARTAFDLPPEKGRAALPRLLDLAKARGIAVEIVALADTIGQSFDYEAHVRELGRITLEKGNAFVEMTNEPGHPTQDRRLHDPAFVQRLAAILPEPLLVALGSVEYGDGYAAGDYATFHFPRGPGQWGHVFGLSAGAARVHALKKPVISDEPIGAAAQYEPARRDNEPARFAAAAALTRLAGMGATFHYEAGINTEIPKGREAACLAAWQMGLALLDDAPMSGEFLEGQAVQRIAGAGPGGRTYARVSSQHATILTVNPAPSSALKPAAEWELVRQQAIPGARVAVLRRPR